MSSIRIVELEKRFANVVAVGGISLTVRDGEFLTLLGPSGCGKTTTLRMVAGFESPTRGRIYFDDIEVTHLPPYRRETGMVFQSLALFPHMTVAENIAYGLRMRRTPAAEVSARVQEMLRLVRLEGLEERRPHQLSGGQQQRVAFARALAIRPKILLLDEPFAALDRKLREEMQVELKRLHSQLGVTTIFVTHNQREAFTLSDRIAVMHQGRLEQVGSPEELYYRPVNRFVADFVGVANFFPVRILERRPHRCALETIDEGVRLELPIPAQACPASERATLMVRPEFIGIETGEEGGIPARVDLLRFVGETVEVRLLTAAGREVVASQPYAAARHLAEGAQVRIRIDSGQVRVLEEGA